MKNIDLEEFLLTIVARCEIASTLDMEDSRCLGIYASAGMLKKETKSESADSQCDGVRSVL